MGIQVQLTSTTPTLVSTNQQFAEYRYRLFSGLTYNETISGTGMIATFENATAPGQYTCYIGAYDTNGNVIGQMIAGTIEIPDTIPPGMHYVNLPSGMTLAIV